MKRVEEYFGRFDDILSELWSHRLRLETPVVSDFLMSPGLREYHAQQLGDARQKASQEHSDGTREAFASQEIKDIAGKTWQDLEGRLIKYMSERPKVTNEDLRPIFEAVIALQELHPLGLPNARD